VSAEKSTNVNITAKPSRAALAARYSAAVFAVVAGSAVLKLLLHRFLAGPRDEQLLGPIILGFVIALFWFAVAFLVLVGARTGRDSSPQPQNPPTTRERTVSRTIALALVVAGVLAISAWTNIYLNDEIFESRSLPWIAPLITVQEYGFGKASQMFPCQAEGSDTGCEAYKWVPTFLVANILLYFPFVLVALFSCRLSDTFRKMASVGAHLFVRWSGVATTAGLLALQVMHGLNLDTQDSLYPHPGVGHWHFGAWEQINDITGTLITIAGLCLPFYLYRLIRRAPSLTDARIRLSEATSLAATMLAALMLGDVY